MPTPAPPQQPHGRGGLTLACRLLPRDLRADVNALYVVFRTLDDLVDEGDSAEAARRVAAVESWCDGGGAASPEAEALARLDERRGVPVGPMRAFCAGMRHDLDGGVLVTEADVDRYCAQVAGAVGEVVTAWLGQRRPCLEEARSLGVALQRTNILRDLDEDRVRGRVYVAAETIERFGPPLPGRRDALLRDQVARADAHYDRGIAGIAGLGRGRPAIAAAAATYREILRGIERDGHGRAPGRVVVPWPRRAAVAARAAAIAH